MHLWLAFAIAALVLWGITGVTQKLSTNRISSERSFLWFCWAMVALTAAILVVTRPGWKLGSLVVICSVAGGALNGLGAWTSFRALESGGKASIVISLIALYPLLTIVLAVAFLGERLTWMQSAGAVVAIAAAILLSIETPAGTQESANVSN
ncbi:MAG TPA: DMT family transporter [Terracidiphilus sp.]|nr:DMT family transporter [Terracidiphilus sp.]